MKRYESEFSPSRERWLAGVSLLAGAGLGAAIMYFCDPVRGKARRNQLKQKGASAAREASREVAKKVEDLLNRAKGLVAEAETEIERGEATVSDDIVAERVRSHLGHLTDHAHGIETQVVDGVVALRGTIARDRKRAVVKEVLSVPGVKGVRDLLIAA